MAFIMFKFYKNLIFIITKKLSLYLPREPQWTSDEKICGLLVGADVILYEDVNFNKIMYRINVAKVARFSISPSNTPYYILCYMPGN